MKFSHATKIKISSEKLNLNLQDVGSDVKDSRYDRIFRSKTGFPNMYCAF